MQQNVPPGEIVIEREMRLFNETSRKFRPLTYYRPVARSNCSIPQGRQTPDALRLSGLRKIIATVVPGLLVGWIRR
jgi:hypothetical protein